jgi:phage replication O-like protein O
VKDLADVQLEHGYTRIANEILEHMATIKLSPTQYRILFLVWRYTYGFKRKSHEMSLTFLSNATGIDKRNIQRELKSLEEKRIIVQEVKNGSFRRITFNKNYEEWINKTTIGEITNGENDEGTIGEINNPTIGETNNPTIGETNNQERNRNKTLNKDLKKDKDDDMQKPNPVTEFEKSFGFPTSLLIEEFNYWIDSDESQFQEPEAIICETILRAKQQIPRNPAKYITKILKDLHNMELFTLEAVQSYNERFDKQRNGEGGNHAKKHTRRTGRTPAKNQESITGGKIGRL